MATRFGNSPSEYIILFTGLDDGMTWMADIYISVDTNTFAPLLTITDGAANFSQVALGADGTTIEISTQNGFTIGSDLSVATWYRIFYTRNVADHNLYINGISDVVRSDNNTLVGVAHAVGGNSLNGLNGRMANMMCWDTVLSQAEMLSQMGRMTPVRFANLYYWLPMFPGAGERMRDYSGAARNFTETGTFTDEAHPPVSWGAPVMVLPYTRPRRAPAVLNDMAVY